MSFAGYFFLKFPKAKIEAIPVINIKKKVKLTMYENFVLKSFGYIL